MRRIAAMIALPAASTIALAQARYEVGYQFDCEPEVVHRVAPPFALETWSPSGWHWVSMRFPASIEEASDWGMISARIFTIPRGSRI